MRTNVKLAILIFVKSLMAFIAIQHNMLQHIGTEYKVNIPVLKYLYALIELLDGWGIQNIVLFVGIAFILFHTQKEIAMQKNMCLSILSGIFAFSTVIGISYTDSGNLNYLVGSGGLIQCIASLIVMAGFFILYKNLIILAYKILLKLHRRSGKYEIFIFESHPFIIPFTIFALTSLPYVICFFPGVIEWDAVAQLNTFYNGIRGTVAHHPIVSTMIMAKSMILGKKVFHSDNMGIFVYTFSQYFFQWMTFSYCIYVISKVKCRYSSILRWFALSYLALFPLFQIWGFMLCKDSVHYISVILFMTAIFHIVMNWKNSKLWQWFIAEVGIAGIVFFRNDGIYLIVFFAFMGVLLNRKNFRIYLFCFLSGVAAYLLVTAVYMPARDVDKGPIREALSIPLQQTARYILEHEDEITEEDADILSRTFEGDWHTLAVDYNPEISDPVKGRFLYDPTDAELKEYFELWWRLLLRHPDTYINAFFNQVYGYFYPDAKCSSEVVANYGMADEKYNLKGINYEVSFAVKNKEIRDVFEEWAEFIYDVPILGMLSSCGMHTYILLGLQMLLINKKKFKENWFFMIGVGTLLIAMVSPVGTCVRYMLPVMVMLPLNIAWCCYQNRENESEKELVINEN